MFLAPILGSFKSAPSRPRSGPAATFTRRHFITRRYRVRADRRRTADHRERTRRSQSPAIVGADVWEGEGRGAAGRPPRPPHNALTAGPHHARSPPAAADRDRCRHVIAGNAGPRCQTETAWPRGAALRNRRAARCARSPRDTLDAPR